MNEPTLISAHAMFNGRHARYAHRSQATGTDMAFSVYLPPQALQGYRVPVLYWLSGLSCTQRVALLKGVPESTLQAIYDERLRLNPGAEALVDACKRAGLKTLLVSGGFTFFTERIRQRLGIDFTRANMLEVENGVLTGNILPQPWGDICDGAEKARTLLEVATLMGISAEQVIAVGDGANDLKMMQEAGVSVAYKAKPTVRRQATIAINEGGLDRLLEVLKV